MAGWAKPGRYTRPSRSCSTKGSIICCLRIPIWSLILPPPADDPPGRCTAIPISRASFLRLRYETLGELLGLFSAITIINTRLSPLCVQQSGPSALVAGGFLLRAARPTTLGGHAAVRGQVVEDVALGTRQGTRPSAFSSMPAQSVHRRMYEGWRDTFHGLKKNAYAGANCCWSLCCSSQRFCCCSRAAAGFECAAGHFSLDHAGIPDHVHDGSAGHSRIAGGASVGWQTARYVNWRAARHGSLPAGFAFYLAVFLGSILIITGRQHSGLAAASRRPNRWPTRVPIENCRAENRLWQDPNLVCRNHAAKQ